MGADLNQPGVQSVNTRLQILPLLFPLVQQQGARDAFTVRV